MRLDSALLSVFADLFINLSAGWFGAAVIIPARSTKRTKIKIGLLTLNFTFGIVFSLLAYAIRKYG